MARKVHWDARGTQLQSQIRQTLRPFGHDNVGTRLIRMFCTGEVPQTWVFA